MHPDLRPDRRGQVLAGLRPGPVHLPPWLFGLLSEELAIRHASGAFSKWLIQLAKTDVLLLDNWGMGALNGITRSDLLEIIDDRTAQHATIITSQLRVEHWHAWTGDATIADAILDRIMQRHHRITLKGDSLRQAKEKPRKENQQTDPS
jgi:DNA replication protein DnaC